MKIEGTHTINAPRDLVWNLMIDSEVLSRCVPGVQSLAASEDGSYKMALKTGVGSIKGLYQGTIKLEEQRAPEHYRMIVDGKGAPGFVKGAGTLELAEQGDETLVTYVGEVSVGGTIASVGQRLILSSARMMTAQFFAALEAEAVAIVKAEANDEPVQTPKQGFLRNVFRATSKAVKGKLNG